MVLYLLTLFLLFAYRSWVLLGNASLAWNRTTIFSLHFIRYVKLIFACGRRWHKCWNKSISIALFSALVRMVNSLNWRFWFRQISICLRHPFLGVVRGGTDALFAYLSKTAHVRLEEEGVIFKFLEIGHHFELRHAGPFRFFYLHACQNDISQLMRDISSDLGLSDGYGKALTQFVLCLAIGVWSEPMQKLKD